MNIKELFSKRILEAEREATTAQVSNKVDKIINGDSSNTSLRETDVGVTEFVSSLPGFRGIIKQRFSDFNVHEIDKDGNLAILNSTELPDETLHDINTDLPPVDETVSQKLHQLMDDSDETASVEIDVTDASKDARKNIHQYIKAKFGSSVVSNTSDSEEKKLIVVTRKTNQSKDNRREGHLPKYLHFIMSKANTDTTNALSVISSKLRIKICNLQVAGTKDKRANTSQWVSLKNAYASTLKNMKGLRNIWVGNFVYKDESLSLGALKGNNFEIALRDIDAPEEVIEHALTQLKEHGFINYYGMQRFGNNAAAATHVIGKHLLREEFKLAVETILKPRNSHEPPDVRAAREIYAKTHDAGKALSALKYQKSVEGKLLEGLKRNGNNAYVNGLDCLPRNIQLLYLHAFQAFLWNKVVSRRIATHGLAVRAGDLVFIGNKEDIVMEEPNESEETEEKTILEEKPCPVRQITAEEVDNFTIYDVVVPVPGASSLLPDNEIADWLREELLKDGLTIEALKGRIKKYSVGGSYRNMLKKPKNLTWRFVRYSTPEEDLILSDPDIMAGKVLPERDGPLRAVILKLDLSPSVYATMALREVLRMDTSYEAQSQLNGPRVKRPVDGDDESPAKKVKPCND